MRQSGPELGCGATQKKSIGSIYVVNNMICYFIVAIYCRYLPSGITFTAREFDFHTARKIIAFVVKETCKKTWGVSSTKEMPLPNKER
jgi:hypothetical protein